MALTQQLMWDWEYPSQHRHQQEQQRTLAMRKDGPERKNGATTITTLLQEQHLRNEQYQIHRFPPQPRQFCSRNGHRHRPLQRLQHSPNLNLNLNLPNSSPNLRHNQHNKQSHPYNSTPASRRINPLPGSSLRRWRPEPTGDRSLHQVAGTPSIQRGAAARVIMAWPGGIRRLVLPG